MTPSSVRLIVWTARVSYGGEDRFDITRKSGGDEGAPFAPSATLFNRMWSLRQEAKQLQEEDARAMLDEAWTFYEADFLAEMRVSYGVPERAWRAAEHEAHARGVRAHREAWARLLARKRVTLVCYCTNPLRCHRAIVARALQKLGADVRGEIPTDTRGTDRQTRLPI